MSHVSTSRRALLAGASCLFALAVSVAVAADLDPAQRLRALLFAFSVVAAGVAGVLAFRGRAPVPVTEPPCVPCLEAVQAPDPISNLPATTQPPRADLGVEERLQREREMRRLAYVDVLTGLPNRAAFNAKLARRLRRAAAAGATVTVMMMDLDRFKAINDTLGHVAGDDTLRQVGARLQILLRDADTVARLGGDEFGILLGDCPSDTAVEVARRILQALRVPLQFEGQPIDVGTSIGIARYPEHGDDDVALLRRADLAMYAAKRSHSGYALYEAHLDEAQRAQLSLLGELRRAVKNSELRVYYQPQVDIATRRVAGAEALVRWSHPTRGLLPPSEFIPYAEQTGFVRAITRWMLEVTLRQCARWAGDGMPLRVSVNVSARDLMNPDFAYLVGEAIGGYEVPAHLVCLEITESSLLEDPDRATVTLRLLHRLGVRLSIDDFGTGFSSLAWLKKMPVDELKIDRSFVAGMRQNRDDQVIVRSTIELAHNLGLKVV
ncbi:MAG TPA: EAL domain-containing protein, partial [Burkholderiaceae bacterium]|nr:EAL domain-containing protein [Burkholderiaceae bacterium]